MAFSHWFVRTSFTKSVMSHVLDLCYKYFLPVFASSPSQRCLFFFLMHCGPCGVLVPRSGVEPAPPSVKVWISWPLDRQGSPQWCLLMWPHHLPSFSCACLSQPLWPSGCCCQVWSGLRVFVLPSPPSRMFPSQILGTIQCSTLPGCLLKWPLLRGASLTTASKTAFPQVFYPALFFS